MSGIFSILFIIVIFLTGLFFIVSTALLSYRNYRTSHSETQDTFIQGTLPSYSPDGPYKGSVSFETNWKGKQFDSYTNTGINLIEENRILVEKYPFKTYIGKGLGDPILDVVKIDYNIPENPLWLRLVLDEIVQVSPQHFLGKVHVRFGPFHMALGFFTLKK